MIKFSFIGIDYGPPHGVLPCCVWDGNNRTVAKIRQQCRKDYKFRLKKSKHNLKSSATKYGMLNYSKLDKDQLEHQIKLAKFI